VGFSPHGCTMKISEPRLEKQFRAVAAVFA